MTDIAEIDEHSEGGESGSALRRIQEFDAQSLVREKELGAKFALRELVEPIQRVQDLFRQIPPSQTAFFPEQQRNTIRDQANAFYNFIEQAEAFEIEGAQPTPSEARQALINKAHGLYQQYFNTLFPLISYATARSQDFAKLEQEARAATQGAKDQAAGVLEELETQREAAETILSEVRSAAAEQGVSKQAIHFKNEADHHKAESDIWMKRTIAMAVIVTIYAIASLFFHHLPGIGRLEGYQAFQLAISKVLIFAVLAYLLLISARNFMSHRHNEVINRHRQNALATFTALAEATSDASSSDIVLSHAASCIFSPQETGLTKQESPSGEGVPSVQLVPRIGQISGASQ